MATVDSIAILVAASLGVGFTSAFIPWINAELLTLAAVATTTSGGGLGAVVAVTVGQTAGKVLIYEAVRAGRNLSARRRTKADRPRPAGRAAGRRRHPRWQAFKAWVKRWSDRGLALMDTRARRVGVLAASAVIGFPPLLLTTVAAGAAKMHRFDFVTVTLVGRLIRFAVVAWPALALRL
ncbi:MAG: hypothetical protein LBG60_00400 [Bifidobacteriaceae bacterium]|jgi:membrane protein YqaA with SNARE-associated domain|nr:hypothetical protein [Bifidobacteriaceae bacterium]